MARRDIGRVGRRVYNVPAAAIFRQVGTNGSTDFHLKKHLAGVRFAPDADIN